MWEMASLCSYDEVWNDNDDMELLGQKLMCTTLELEKLKSEAMDEMRRNKEYIKQLILLLKSAIQERDEARYQFQKLLTTAAGDSPLFKPAKANSSVAESNSLSETYNLHSRASSLFDAAVTSPDFSAVNHHSRATVDRTSSIIDNLAKGRILPQKGTLLQTVMRAGPLLQTLLVAGPLPRWRRPPQLHPSQIPPFSINGCQGRHPKPYSQNQVELTFANSASSMMNAPFAKRQRFS